MCLFLKGKWKLTKLGIQELHSLTKENIIDGVHGDNGPAMLGTLSLMITVMKIWRAMERAPESQYFFPSATLQFIVPTSGISLKGSKNIWHYLDTIFSTNFGFCYKCA